MSSARTGCGAASPARIFSKRESYTAENLADVASDTGATHVVSGFLTKAGEEFRIDISIQDMKTNTSLGSEEVKGTGEQSLFAMVDELKTRIKARFGQSGAQPLSEKGLDIGQITTSSPDAFKYYLEGRKFHHRGDYRRSIAFMEDAVKIDPGFAMAYRSMAAAYDSLGNAAKSTESIKKALELSDRLSEREKDHYPAHLLCRVPKKPIPQGPRARGSIAQARSERPLRPFVY